MMKRLLYRVWAVGVLACLVSCNEQEVLEIQPQGKQITAKAISSGGTSVFSRLGFEDQKDGDGGVGITWGEGDKFYMKGTHGASATMSIEEGEAGKKTALFTGSMMDGTLAENETITAYYPASAYNQENNCFDVDFRTITQDCTPGNEMNHLSDTYLMTGTGEMREEAVGVSFVGGTKIAMLRFDLTLPQQAASGLKIKELLIVSEDLKTVGTLSGNGEFTADEALEKHSQKVVLNNLDAKNTSETEFSVYVNVIPVKLTKKMRLRVALSDGTVYWYDIDNWNNVELQANNRYYIIRALLETQKVGVDYSWYTDNKSAGTFYIHDEADLRGLSKIVNGKANGVTSTTFQGKIIVLENNIDLKVNWAPIGWQNSTSYVFRGTFDGGGHTISGIHCDEDMITDNIVYNAVGFFGVTLGATIENLTTQGYVHGKRQFVGGIVGRNIKGETALSVIRNCRNEICVSSTYSSSGSDAYVGGIVGYTYGTSIIECSNSGSLKAIDSKACLGGIAGGFSGRQSSCNIVACYNEGMMEPISSETRVGGIVGTFYEERNYHVPLIACYNLTENLVKEPQESQYIGGIVGYVNSTSDRMHHIYGCYSLSNSLFGYKNNKTDIDTSSCLLLGSENKNSQDQAVALNVGITTWNNTENTLKCNYHFEVGTNHLVVVGGAPEASTESETEGQS